ncbi:hypothetical protein [Bacillus benzoevorans]|uniref:Putative lipid-binding transport protein (Tim44 family) n=1 Tax=Bacillus benzoevorans TaxID=1456 RepID=A0A7X0HQS3_9BACI|nr:hypothetical protein [Bacillus benzoevorans]MBB6443900.1 putative lipid-binding transport protein (Tim44 family) [Bacillus benzoevorans]
MKKLIAALFSAVLIFTPVGNVIFNDHTTTVEAKGYKSGKKSFSPNNNRSNPTTNFQKKDNTTNSTVNKSTVNKGKTGGFFSGGLMKGLMLGGLAGLLFGSLFANMGILGSVLGLLVNILGIMILIAVIRKIFSIFRDKKKKEDPNPWRN